MNPERRDVLRLLAGAPLIMGMTKLDMSLEEAAHDAWIYGSPLIETALVRSAVLKQTPANTLVRYRSMATPRSRAVTTPNVDTIYSGGWLDLASGAVALTIPDLGTRYISVALLDTYSNNFAILGTSNHRKGDRHVTIVGPGVGASPGTIRAPTRWAWVIVRIAVFPDDTAEALHALQDRVVLTGPTSTARPAAGCSRDADASSMLACLTALLAESPPPPADSRALPSLARLGLLPSLPARPSVWTAAELRDIEAGFTRARGQTRAMRRPGKGVHWLRPQPSMGNFGTNYAYRAEMAVKGLAALPNHEAMYFWAVAPDGGLDFGSAAGWRMTLPQGGLPVDAFWSLTAYETTPGGQSYLIDNPASRYAVGSNHGLVRGADGATELYIQRKPPTGPAANWLPSPPSRPLQLILRAYLPRSTLLNGHYQLPPITRATS